MQLAIVELDRNYIVREEDDEEQKGQLTPQDTPDTQ